MYFRSSGACSFFTPYCEKEAQVAYSFVSIGN